MLLYFRDKRFLFEDNSALETKSTSDAQQDNTLENTKIKNILLSTSTFKQILTIAKELNLSPIALVKKVWNGSDNNEQNNSDNKKVNSAEVLNVILKAEQTAQEIGGSTGT